MDLMPIREDLAALTVTVVDDEPSMRDILVRAAWSWGYACQSAGNAEEALPMLAECPTPLVVTDLRMPGNGGVWLVREIQRLWPGTGIIVVTAGEDNDAALECLNAGADRYLLKPLRLEEFRHALAATLRTVRRNASVIGGTSSTWCKRRRATCAIPSCRPSTAWCGRWKHATRTPRGTPCASAIWRCAWRRPSAWIALRAAS
ncbi:MAG: response regulator [Planctomycetota bacterium]|nr:MAG: response regulator [Planctomycetota bacterium]